MQYGLEKDDKGRRRVVWHVDNVRIGGCAATDLETASQTARALIALRS